MKNKLLIAVGLSLASVCASAQNYFGVTGGYNLTNMHHEMGSSDFERDPKSGFNIGASYEHRFHANGKGYPFLDACLLYSQEGYFYSDKDLKFLKIPVGVGYDFQLTRKFGLAPKVFGVLDVEMSDVSASDNNMFFAFGGGANLNIGEKFSIGIGYELRRESYGSNDDYYSWFNTFHTNLTYYIFSK